MHAQQNQKSSLRTYITLLEIVKKNLNHTVTQSMRHVVALLLHKNISVPYKTFTKFLLSLLFCGYKVSQTLHKGSGSNFSSNLSPNIFFAHSPPFLCFFVATSFLYNQIRQAISTTEKKITWNLVETLDTHIKQEFLK